VRTQQARGTARWAAVRLTPFEQWMCSNRDAKVSLIWATVWHKRDHGHTRPLLLVSRASARRRLRRYTAAF